MGFWPRGLLLSDCTWGCRLNCADPRGSRKTPRAEAPCGPAASPSSADSGLCLLQSASSHPQSQAVAHTKKGMLETPERSGLSALSLESAEDLCQGLLGATHWYPDTSHSLGAKCQQRGIASPQGTDQPLSQGKVGRCMGCCLEIKLSFILMGGTLPPSACMDCEILRSGT